MTQKELRKLLACELEGMVGQRVGYCKLIESMGSILMLEPKNLSIWGWHYWAIYKDAECVASQSDPFEEQRQITEQLENETIENVFLYYDMTVEILLTSGYNLLIYVEENKATKQSWWFTNSVTKTVLEVNDQGDVKKRKLRKKKK